VEDQATTPESIPGRQGPRARLLEALLLALLALAMNLVGNGRTSLWDRDEPRYAGCTREMRESGDYIHPTFNAEPRYHKPVLTYWLMLGGTALGGDNEFGARLVSAFMGMGTVLLVWTLGRRMFGPRIGRLAALVLATAPIMVAESKLATTDAPLMFFLVACLLALWELARAPSARWAAVFWVALALATLTKGPVGPAFLGVAGVASWAWGGPTACWRRLRWRWGVPGFILLTAPWYVAIGIISGGDFYRVSMGHHVLHRMTTGMETHGGFPGYYVAFTLGVFYPWSALLPAALLAAWSRRRSNPALGFAAGWTLGPLIMLELVRTKLIHYYLPAYAGAALLVAWLVVAVAESEINLRRWPLGRLALGMVVGLGLAIAVALMAGAVVIGGGLRGPCILVSIVVGAGTLYAFERFHGGHAERAAQGLVGAWAVALLLIGAWLLPAAEPYRLSPLVARRLRDVGDREHARPILAAFQPPCVVYNYGEPIPTLQTKDWLFEKLRRDGAIVAALSDEEVRLLDRHPELSLETCETLEGFDVERARVRTLRLTLIRHADASAPGLARSPEQSEVK
jgi:4-amino-4-deoxy-L-arabinose transferase-like glycosyltransferase